MHFQYCISSFCPLFKDLSMETDVVIVCVYCDLAFCNFSEDNSVLGDQTGHLKCFFCDFYLLYSYISL